MNTKSIHLLLAYDEQVPSEILDEFCQSVEVKHLKFKRQSLPSRGPQSSLELVSFTAITAYLLKPYFEGFLQEAGKDHYDILKKALKNMWSNIFGHTRKVRFIVLTSGREIKPEYSPVFSIYAEINSGKMVKLLMRDDCTEEDYNMTIDSFFSLLESYYFDYSSDNHSIHLDNEKSYSKTIFIEFDPITKTVRTIDPRYKRRRPPLT